MNVKGLPWPDRLGIGATLIVVLFISGIGALASKWTGGGGLDAGGWVDTIVFGLKVEAIIALPVWILARIIDFVAGGPQRRAQISN